MVGLSQVSCRCDQRHCDSDTGLVNDITPAKENETSQENTHASRPPMSFTSVGLLFDEDTLRLGNQKGGLDNQDNQRKTFLGMGKENFKALARTDARCQVDVSAHMKPENVKNVRAKVPIRHDAF